MCFRGGGRKSPPHFFLENQMSLSNVRPLSALHVAHSNAIAKSEWRDDWQGRTAKKDAGWYVVGGLLSGPFKTEAAANRELKKIFGSLKDMPDVIDILN